jgi:hypothetical protein
MTARQRSKDIPTDLAFLFALPDSAAIRQLDARGDYFNVRTGDTWDLFFPGYRKSRGNDSGRWVTRRAYGRRWRFDAEGFNTIREYVERESGRRWEYSGSTDLVLINCWIHEHGEPTIDWASTISGQLTDQVDGVQTLTLANIIERISRDLGTAAEDPSYGVSRVTNDSQCERAVI